MTGLTDMRTHEGEPQPPPFKCAQCGEPIGLLGSHLLLGDGRVVCMRHHEEFYNASMIRVRFWKRNDAAQYLGVWSCPD